MTIHELKTIQPHFDALWEGRKTFELRRNDRAFQVGDILRLMEWREGYYTGREFKCRITYILPKYEDAIMPNYCIMSLGPIS